MIYLIEFGSFKGDGQVQVIHLQSRIKKVLIPSTSRNRTITPGLHPRWDKIIIPRRMFGTSELRHDGVLPFEGWNAQSSGGGGAL